MFNKLKTFWNSFWNAIKTAYNKTFRQTEEVYTQSYRDIRRINPLSVFVDKLCNLANTEATFEVESDSTQAEQLKSLCANLEDNRFKITSEMLGTGEMWVFPATDSEGRLYHRYLPKEYASILDMNGEQITDILGVIDEYTDSKTNKTYFLNRRQTLRQTLKGNVLTVETYTTTVNNERVSIEHFADDEGVYQFSGVDNVGVGRFKSPKSIRDNNDIYGKPLNYDCEEIEAKIFNDYLMIEQEFKNGESKIFADPLILRKGKDKVGQDSWQIPENVFPIDTRGGTSSASIDIFSPAIRYSEYQSKLLDDMKQYEQQVGTDRGFLTPFESGTSATATEIRRANASTIALIDRIHNAIKVGVESTLKADAIFLNVAPDLYSVVFDWYDAFEDTDKQYERIASAVDRGVLEKSDELKWLYPNMSQEEIAEKLARMEVEKQVNTDLALERILQGQ